MIYFFGSLLIVVNSTYSFLLFFCFVKTIKSIDRKSYWRVLFWKVFFSSIIMNENQSNYILILKTLQADLEENINVIIKGIHGQTEKISLRKSQVEINN